ncbi:MAG: NADH-quinone oxidoreductase subunit NuoG [Cytophagales bacterium]|nr:NADH-quinone oxidoreductase subunit NuoG [Cytophagales bacterium]
MIEFELDGKKVEAEAGSMVIAAAAAAGTFIPHFCYHKKLSVAANCRMCLVDIEKMPKPMPACATAIAPGMIVRTKSDKAIKAQQSVMEFLLINHPLDCPICDQGGECQLQDLAVGYGGSSSRYEEEKRVVTHKDVGPLISMEEMSRCIHCTRCVRFGQEVAGVMELGMIHRGEHSEITTVAGDTVDSELSGNMIDICPVGALTSKPFRYSARTWELSRRKSVSPHDSTGANLIVQVKNNKVMRVVPLENEAVNECWIADRDRYSYEALNSTERLTTPMIKQGGVWKDVDWQTALEYVANGIKQIKREHGASAIGTLASPHSTVEELFLAAALMRGIGSDNIDYRLRTLDFTNTSAPHVRWLGTSIASLSDMQRVLVVGSNLRKDHPLFAQRIRQAVRKGAQVSHINEVNRDWAMHLANSIIAPSSDWAASLADTRLQQWLGAPDVATGKKIILLGNAAAHHADASKLLALAQQLAASTGAVVGYLTEAANTVGAQHVGALPQTDGLNASQMLASEGGGLKAALLLGCEPAFDSAAGQAGVAALARMQMVVSLNAFKTNLDCADVLLPIAPFTETSGTFVNAEGRAQSFHAVVKPLGQTRPAWKVLRVLGNMLGVAGFEFDSSQDVLAAANLDHSKLSNAANPSAVSLAEATALQAKADKPCTASIYQLDGLVRRAPALQLTADARTAHWEIAA